MGGSSGRPSPSAGRACRKRKTPPPCGDAIERGVDGTQLFGGSGRSQPTTGFSAWTRTATGSVATMSPEMTAVWRSPRTWSRQRTTRSDRPSQSRMDSDSTETSTSLRRRYSIRSAIEHMGRFQRSAYLRSSGTRIMVPSSAMISQITPAGACPARRAMSTLASVWPQRTRNAGHLRATKGNMWPGETRSSRVVVGSTSACTVHARSAAEIPWSCHDEPRWKP